LCDSLTCFGGEDEGVDRVDDDEDEEEKEERLLFSEERELTKEGGCWLMA